MNTSPEESSAPFWPQAVGPLLATGAAAVIELLSRGPLNIPNPPAILLMDVVLSAFAGGVRSGLMGRVWAEGEPEGGATFYFTLARSEPA